MKRSILGLVIIPFSLAALAQNQASVVRNTDLKAQAFSDAATLKVLTENQKVDVISRKASWSEVRLPGVSGWVKMLSLRFESTASSSTGNDGVKNLINVISTGSSGSVPTTAVRGFDESKIANATPSQTELAKMKLLSTSKEAAEKFAKQEKLLEQKQEYIKPAGGKS